MANLLTARRGRLRWDWTDWAAHLYLVLGTLVMFGPVLWLGLSSVKSESGLQAYPPTILPYEQARIDVPERGTLKLFHVTQGEHAGQDLAEVRRLGLQSQLVDPANPGTLIRLPIEARTPVMRLHAAWENFTDLFSQFSFARIVWNSVFITVVATVLTLLVNSMAAFALSKYKFSGRDQEIESVV